MEYLRTLDAPMAVKYLACVFMAFTWKWWYYAPNTFKQLKANERRRKGIPQPGSVTAPQTFDFGWLIGMGDHTHFSGTEFLVRCLGPYFVQRFVLAPLPFLMIGWPAYFRSLITLALAELCTNFHSFIVIATNHAGFDLYRFEKHCKPRSVHLLPAPGHLERRTSPAATTSRTSSTASSTIKWSTTSGPTCR